MRTMTARGPIAAALALGVWTATAAAEPAPVPVDIKPLRDRLIVLADASGGTYVVTPGDGAEPYQVFYGTGATLYAQIQVGRSRNGAAWAFSLYAPRIPDARHATLARRADGTYERSCVGGGDAVILSELTGAKAAAVLDKSRFMSTQIVRRAVFLGRDDTGVYYFVDAVRAEYGGKGFRVFVGKKGAMKQVQLTDVASDSAGEVFASKTGDLRLVRDQVAQDRQTATWIRGGKRTELTPLDVHINSLLIHRELRVYKSLGTFCDHL